MCFHTLIIASEDVSTSLSHSMPCLPPFLFLSFSLPSLPQSVSLWGLMKHTHIPKAVQRKKKNKCASKKQNKRLKRHLGGKLRNQGTRQQGLPRLRSQTVCFASYVDAAALFLPVWFCPAMILCQAASHKLYLHRTPRVYTQQTNNTYLPVKKKQYVNVVKGPN